MTPTELQNARKVLGEMWGFGRALHRSEMGRACGLGPRDPGQMIRKYEEGKASVSPPMAILVRLYLKGIMPPDGLEGIRR